MTRLSFSPLLFLVVLTACGGGSSDPSSSGSIAGNWQITLNSNPAKTPSGFLLQAGNSVSGGLLISGNCAGLGATQGQVAGSNVALIVNGTSQTLSLTGTAMADGSSMSGNYSILASGCGASEVGTWTATQVAALTGNFQATFISTVTSNLSFSFTGTVTQGPNTGTSYASLSGSMTSTDSPCFSGASISGQISGTSAVLNLATSDGTSLGKITATATTNASSMSGTYAFVNAQMPLACGTDFGTVVFSFNPFA